MITTRRTSIPATSAFSMTSSAKTTDWELTVDSVVPRVVIYDFALPSTDGVFNGSTGTVTVVKIELEFWHYMADGDDPIKELQFVQSTLPAVLPPALLYSHINSSSTVFVEHESHGNEKTKATVVIGESDSSPACTQLTNQINNPSSITVPFCFGIRRTTDPTPGSIKLGGIGLKNGIGEIWGEGSPTSDPILTITWTDDGTPTDFAEFEMLYTTEDPSTSQLTPSNSIGGYASSNEVYVASQVANSVNTTQTSIYIDPDGSLPTESSGLVQTGPEIMRYANLDRTNFLLSGISRGVSPGYPFPAAVYPTNDAVHFLEVDRLFNTRPTRGLVQYRCIAIKLKTSATLQSPKVFLRQHPDAQVVVDIGIEVPAFDRHSGVTAGLASGAFIQSSSADVLGYDADYFVGAHIIVSPDSSPKHSIVTSYEHDGSVATFLLEDSFTSNNGTAFRINPAPAYRASSEINGPTMNSGRFLGFLSEGGTNEVVFEEQGTSMRQHDLFYLWIKRTLSESSKTTNSTGAVIMLRIDATSIS